MDVKTVSEVATPVIPIGIWRTGSRTGHKSCGWQTAFQVGSSGGAGTSSEKTRVPASDAWRRPPTQAASARRFPETRQRDTAHPSGRFPETRSSRIHRRRWTKPWDGWRLL